MQFNTCLVPKDFNPQDELLSASKITYPDIIDNRSKCLATEDQGNTSTCAAHTATSWAEVVNWKRTGIFENLDPYKVYDYAKKIDGYPEVDGTTLDAVCKSLIYYKMLIGVTNSDVKCYSDVNTLKSMIHRYDTVLTAFSIDKSWIDQPCGVLDLVDTNRSVLGGHAVLACGYDSKGLLIQNSWGKNWGKYGFARIPWHVVGREFQYCAIIRNCFNNFS